MKSYEIMYNKVLNKYQVWAVWSNGNAEIVKMATKKRSCELWLMQKGVRDWTDRA